MSRSLNVVRGNQQVKLTCKVGGDDIAGGYWERINGNALPNRNNGSTTIRNGTLQLTITRARPDHSGQYHCVVYSQWGMAQSREAKVTITSEIIAQKFVDDEVLHLQLLHQQSICSPQIIGLLLYKM